MTTNDDTFENLEVWKDAIDLGARVYELFRGCTDYGFRKQIQMAEFQFRTTSRKDMSVAQILNSSGSWTLPAARAGKYDQ
jgi:hypothetical protein